MAEFFESLTWEKILSIGQVALKPLIVLILCIIAINLIVRLIAFILGKLKVGLIISKIIRIAIRVVLWILTIAFVAHIAGVDVNSLFEVAKDYVLQAIDYLKGLFS